MTLSWRSALFVPACDEARLNKAHTRGADALVLDLEDGVTPRQKAAARTTLGEAMERLTGLGQEVAVRINVPWREVSEDLACAVRPGIAAIVAPKVEEPARLHVLSQMIGEWEAERGMALGSVRVVALVESPRGLAAVHELAAAPRVSGLALGPEDFTAALGAAPSSASLDLPCSMIALAAAARGLMSLGLPASLSAYKDLTVFRDAALRAKALGVTGSLCIHPAQAAVLNDAFSPSQAELDDARRTLEAWILAGGAGVATIDGRMIDAPVALRAARLAGRAT